MIGSLTSDFVDEEYSQPHRDEIQNAVLAFPGPIVSYRGFLQNAPRKLRKIIPLEFQSEIEKLSPDFGTVARIRVPRQIRKLFFFLNTTRCA